MNLTDIVSVGLAGSIGAAARFVLTGTVSPSY